MSVLVKAPIFAPRDLERDVLHKVVAPLAGIVRKPHISMMLEDAYCIVAWELRDLKALVESGTPMDLNMSKKFEILSRQLASLAAAERKQNEADHLDKLDDKELLEMAGLAAKKLSD